MTKNDSEQQEKIDGYKKILLEKITHYEGCPVLTGEIGECFCEPTIKDFELKIPITLSFISRCSKNIRIEIHTETRIYDQDIVIVIDEVVDSKKVKGKVNPNITGEYEE